MSKGRAFLVVGHKNIHFKRGFDGFDRLMNSSDSVCRISASGETLKNAFRLRRVFISTLALSASNHSASIYLPCRLRPAETDEWIKALSYQLHNMLVHQFPSALFDRSDSCY
jgi:hypothetical protein